MLNEYVTLIQDLNSIRISTNNKLKRINSQIRLINKTLYLRKDQDLLISCKSNRLLIDKLLSATKVLIKQVEQDAFRNISSDFDDFKKSYSELKKRYFDLE